jgi:hypothetical protein
MRSSGERLAPDVDPHQPPAPVLHDNLLCAGGKCSRPVNQWEPQALTLYCSEDCRIPHEVYLLFKKFGF